MKNIVRIASLLLICLMMSCSSISTGNNCVYSFDWSDTGIDGLNRHNQEELGSYKYDCND